MDKEKLMQFISDAIDKGAKIEVGFYSSTSMTQEEANGRAKELSEIVGSAVVVAESSDCEWFKVESEQVLGCFFYKNSFKNFRWMEEDVDLSGSDYERGEGFARASND
jgi:hypothetical protein